MKCPCVDESNLNWNQETGNLNLTARYSGRSAGYEVISLTASSLSSFDPYVQIVYTSHVQCTNTF